jgi:hypothetical protein
MAKRADPKVKARAIVVEARAKAKQIVANARAKAKQIVASARARAKALMAAAKARAKAKREKARAKKLTPKRARERKPLTLWQRAAKMTAREIKAGAPRIPVEGVLSAINAFYANPEFKGPLFIGAIRGQRPLLGKREIDYQITELARMGVIRLLQPDEVRKRGIKVEFQVRSKGYPSEAPRYLALEKVERKP